MKSFVHILIGSCDPRSVNGVNKVVHSLATMQTSNGLRSEVWALKLDHEAPTHDHTYPMRVFRRTRARFTLSKDLKTALGALTPDTWVQLHSVYVPELTAIARFLKKRGILYGVTPHGGYLSLYFDPSRTLRLKKIVFARLWENWMLRNAAMIHTIGATEIEDLEKRAPGKKIVIIPNGYTPDIPEPFAHPREETQPAAIMFCGRHEIKQKGLDLLIKGYAIYRKQGGTLDLVLISGGKDNAFLRSLAAHLGVADSIQWPGVLPVEQLRSTLRGAAAFVHTSRFDVLPTACLEAAALAIPLFMSWETNFEEYITPRNAGWTIRPNTPERIAELMSTIEQTGPTARLAMGENARRMIQEELRWDFISAKLVKAAQTCMDHAKQPPVT